MRKFISLGGIDLERSNLLKILLIELVIVTFIKFQILEEKNNANLLTDGKGTKNDEEKIKEEEKAKIDVLLKKDKDNLKEKGKIKSDSDIYEIISKSKDFAGSIKPYLKKRDQYYIDMFTKIAEIVEIQRNLINIPEEEIKAMDETEIDYIGILKAMKNYMTYDKQDLIEKFLNLHEAIKNIHSKMDKYSDKDAQNINPFDKIIDIYEALKPIIPDSQKEKAEKLVKNIRLLEALNKAEGIMNSMKETYKKPEERITTRLDTHETKEKLPEKIDDDEELMDKKGVSENVVEITGKDENSNVNIDTNDDNKNQSENALQGLSPQQTAMIDNLKSMLTKEQQQYMYNMINYLKQQGNANKNGKDTKNSIEEGNIS